MSALPPPVREGLTHHLGHAPTRVTPLSGGDISRAVRVETGRQTVFVKWRDTAPPGFFAAEADGLARLRAAGALRVPEVIAWDDHSAPAFLVLEYIPPRPPAAEAAFARRLGEGLARLHRENTPPDGLFGLDRDNYLGAQPQPNTPPMEHWTDFYRDRRLRPQVERARRERRLDPSRGWALEAILDRLDGWLGDLPSTPSLLHGDLWSGNFLTHGDEPVLLDPAVYYGEREVDLAFTELFGGFPAGFLAAYGDAYPLHPGYARRRPLHQLFPLLVHLNHFGETYGPAVDRACRTLLTDSA